MQYPPLVVNGSRGGLCRSLGDSIRRSRRNWLGLALSRSAMPRLSSQSFDMGGIEPVPCSVCPTAASAAELGAAAHALLASGWWAPSVSSASTTAPVCRARNSIGTIGTIRMIRGGWAAASAHLTGSVAWPVGTITTAFKRSASRWELMLPLAVHPGPPWLGRSQQQPLVMGMPWASQHNCRRHG